jgi:hypothetical protein
MKFQSNWLRHAAASGQALLCALALITLCAKPAWGAEATPIWGVGVHLPSGQTNATELRSLLQRLGVTSFRDDVQWSQLEKEPGVFRFQNANAQIDDLIAGRSGPRVPGMLVLHSDNALHFRGMPRTDEDREAFAEYVKVVFERFGDQVSGYEVWNEWNLGAGARDGPRGSVEDYVRLLERVRRVADEVGIKAPLIAGAVGNRDMAWIRRFVQLGGLRLAEGFSVHPYNHSARDASAEEVVSWMDGLDRELRQANGGKSKPLYITEIGWPTHDKGTDEATAGARLFKMNLLLQSRPYVAGVWWYDLFDDGNDPSNREHRFGLMHKDHTPKPAFNALMQFMQLAAKRTVVRSTTTDKGTIVQLSESPGQPNIVAWAPERTVSSRLRGASGPASRRLSLDNGSSAAETKVDSSGPVELSTVPVLLNASDAANVKLD